MKSSIHKSTYKAIYRLLDKVSPITGDCGKLCNAICCTYGDPNDEELGIYLLPGEDKLFSQQEDWLRWAREDALDYDFPASWTGSVFFIRCKTPPHCERNMRPLQCRTFPLAPHLTTSGELLMIINNARLPYQCPLVNEHEKYPLNPSFVKATYTVWRHLIRDRLIYDLISMDSRCRIREGRELKIIYPY